MITPAYPSQPGLAPANPNSLFPTGAQGFWFDPSDFGTMFQDDAGTVPVTAVGQAVGRILDKSGRGNHATQATAGNKPVLAQDAGGRYYLEFDGATSNRWMATPTIAYGGSPTVFVGAAFERLTDAVVGCVAESSANLNTNTGCFSLLTPTGANQNIGFAAKNTSSSGYVASAILGAAPVKAVACGYSDSSAPLTHTYINGVLRATSGSSIGTGGFTDHITYIGLRGGASLPLTANLYQLIVSTKAMNQRLIEAMSAYLNGTIGAY